MIVIAENIRAARTKAGLSQEDVALRCHVVRQTVAKWEKGLSVPDADVLITLADALSVPVSQLLGISEIDPADHAALADELARANAALADAAAHRRLQEQANRVRGAMMLVCTAALLVSLRAGESTVGMIAVGAGMVLCLVLLWRNAGVLTHVTSPGADVRPIRMVTAFNICFISVVVLLAVLLGKGAVPLGEQAEKWLVTALASAAILFFGRMAPKLPFNRHTGLRLPWTVMDEETWNLAHRLLGVISLPTVLLYAAGNFIFSKPETPLLLAMAVYIGVPGVISGVFFWRKNH